jgi:putative hydrolase of the HAD superfamily
VTPDPPGARPPSGYRAVIFDLGGVVMPSPMESFRAYERRNGLPHRFISEVVVNGGDHGAWSRLERGELTVAAWCAPFEADGRAHGVVVDARRLMNYIVAAGRERPQMLRAVARLREHGVRVGALTNNWVRDDAAGTPHRLRMHFDVIVESQAVRLRKPDPRIYELACRELGVAPPETAFLDDIGMNLKPARALGIRTIKVDDPDVALRELSALVGLDLLA